MKAGYLSEYFTGVAMKTLSAVEARVLPLAESRASPLMRIRAEVALDCANCDFSGAVAKWRRGQQLIERLPDGSAQTSSEHRWSEWLEQIQAREDAVAAQATSYDG